MALNPEELWQPMIGDEVVQGWRVRAVYAWQAKDLIEAAMVKKKVYSLKHNWEAGGRTVGLVPAPDVPADPKTMGRRI